jgi:tripeptidyl-peptidase-1
MAPDPASVQAVSSWLASEGITPQIHAGHGDWLGFNASVADASRLFNASFSTYRHKDSGHEAIRTMSYSIPASIQQHVQTVYPMTKCVRTLCMRAPY